MKAPYSFWAATLILAGLIIGVGMFSLPYTALKAGFFIFLGWLIFLTWLTTAIHLAFGEIILRTKEAHALPGYAQIYLGRWAKILLSISGLFGVIPK